MNWLDLMKEKETRKEERERVSKALKSLHGKLKTVERERES